MTNKPLKLYFVDRCSNNNATVRYKEMLLNLQAYQPFQTNDQFVCINGQQLQNYFGNEGKSNNVLLSCLLLANAPFAFQKKNSVIAHHFFIGNRPAVVIGKQNNKYRKINTALISKKKKNSDKNTSRFTFLMAAQSSRISISLNIYTIQGLR